MAYSFEGTIEIPLTELWEFVKKFHPDVDEVFYGVPRVNKDNQTLEISLAASNSCHPCDWAEKSAAEKEWEEQK